MSGLIRDTFAQREACPTPARMGQKTSGHRMPLLHTGGSRGIRRRTPIGRRRGGSGSGEEQQRGAGQSSNKAALRACCVSPAQLQGKRVSNPGPDWGGYVLRAKQRSNGKTRGAATSPSQIGGRSRMNVASTTCKRSRCHAGANNRPPSLRTRAPLRGVLITPSEFARARLTGRTSVAAVNEASDVE